jgi:hypothetical protein
MLIERLEHRCELFATYTDANNQNWYQAFYVAIVRAFGVPVNTESFEELAIKLPYELVIKHQQSLFQQEALFMGTAGLLENPHTDLYYQGLQNEYSFLKKKYGISSINTPLRMGKMRPMNSPYIKLAQIAALFHHVPQIIHIAMELPKLSVIKENLNFSLSDYWLTHYNFNTLSAKIQKNLSVNFINHLFINAIIPFVFFYQKTKEPTDVAVEYLESLPGENNSIIAKWKTLQLPTKNAANTQALLHLYKSYCVPQKCLQCNLGKKLLLKNDATI